MNIPYLSNYEDYALISLQVYSATDEEHFCEHKESLMTDTHHNIITLSYLPNPTTQAGYDTRSIF